MKLLPAGESAILVELEGAALPLARALRASGHPAVTDVVPAESTVLIRFDRRVASARSIADWVGSVPVGEGEGPDEGEVGIDVRYDGADLAEAAVLAGLSEAELVQAHTAATWRVMFSGFAPGFGYLRCDDRRLDVPRRDASRTSVPVGSVALAAGYCGIYPRRSPGGWQLIGRTDAILWDAAADPPALLRPGVRVRFRAT